MTITQSQWRQMNQQRLYNDLREVWALISEHPGLSVRAIARKMDITHARSRKLTEILIIRGKIIRGNHNEMGTLRAPIPLLTGPYIPDTAKKGVGFMLLSETEVLEIIDPVDPDNLQWFNNVWVAKWAPPVLGGDIEALKRTPGVTIAKDEYEPEGLPDWAAIDFTIDTKEIL